MSLTPQEIDHMAHLARLELTHDEKERFARQLSAVFQYMQILNTVDTQDVTPTSQVTGLKNIMDTDQVVPCDEKTRKMILENFPDRYDNYLKVPRIFT